MRRLVPIAVVCALAGCAPVLVEWRGPRAYTSSLPEPTKKAASARYCACPPKHVAFDDGLPDGMFGKFANPVPGLVAFDPTPPPPRHVFGEAFHAETIGSLEARFHAPLEETLDPWLSEFEPNPAALARTRETLEASLEKAVAHAEAALVEPSAELLRELRIAREAYDDAKRSADDVAMHDARATLSRTYSLGMARLRATATTAMASVVAESSPPELANVLVNTAAEKIAKEAGMESKGVHDVVRAAAKRHLTRRSVAIAAGDELDAVVLRHRPACAVYLTFK